MPKNQTNAKSFSNGSGLSIKLTTCSFEGIIICFHVHELAFTTIGNHLFRSIAVTFICNYTNHRITSIVLSQINRTHLFSAVWQHNFISDRYFVDDVKMKFAAIYIGWVGSNIIDYIDFVVHTFAVLSTLRWFAYRRGEKNNLNQNRKTVHLHRYFN